MLITCANVANLLLARGAQREKELAIRKAIGAPARRVLRQLLTESAVLAAAGVVLGVALSTLAFAYLARLIPAHVPGRRRRSALDWRVLAFAIGLTVLTVLLFGAGPALVAARRGFNDALRSGVGANAAPRVRPACATRSSSPRSRSRSCCSRPRACCSGATRPCSRSIRASARTTCWSPRRRSRRRSTRELADRTRVHSARARARARAARRRERGLREPRAARVQGRPSVRVDRGTSRRRRRRTSRVTSSRTASPARAISRRSACRCCAAGCSTRATGPTPRRGRHQRDRWRGAFGPTRIRSDGASRSAARKSTIHGSP